MKVWNPKVNPKDKKHLMPIITPVYPASNSTYNVTESTLDLLKKEINRGLQVSYSFYSIMRKKCMHFKNSCERLCISFEKRKSVVSFKRIINP